MDQTKNQNPGQQGQGQQNQKPDRSQNADKDQAEGTRDTIRGDQGQQGGGKGPGGQQGGGQRPGGQQGGGQRPGGQQGGQSTPRQQGTDKGGGITNRPVDLEQDEQEQVPSRGQTKTEDRGNG